MVETCMGRYAGIWGFGSADGRRAFFFADSMCCSRASFDFRVCNYDHIIPEMGKRRFWSSFR